MNLAIYKVISASSVTTCPLIVIHYTADAKVQQIVCCIKCGKAHFIFPHLQCCF